MNLHYDGSNSEGLGSHLILIAFDPEVRLFLIYTMAQSSSRIELI